MNISFRKLLLFSIIFFICAIVIALFQKPHSQTFPEKPSSLKLVNDFAQIYNIHEYNLLEEKLIAYSNKTSTQIAVVTITSLGGYPIDDYTIKLANKWQIGQKGKDNGLLVLIAKEDRKVYIASGYGMEGVLNDGKLGTIIRTQIIPQFKKGNYYAGTNDGIDAMIAAADGEYVNDKINNNQNKSEESNISFFSKALTYILLFFMFVFFIYDFRGKFRDNLSNGGISYGDNGDSGGFGGGRFGGGGAGGSW